MKKTSYRTFFAGIPFRDWRFEIFCLFSGISRIRFSSFYVALTLSEIFTTVAYWRKKRFANSWFLNAFSCTNFRADLFSRIFAQDLDLRENARKLVPNIWMLRVGARKLIRAKIFSCNFSNFPFYCQISGFLKSTLCNPHGNFMNISCRLHPFLYTPPTILDRTARHFTRFDIYHRGQG